MGLWPLAGAALALVLLAALPLPRALKHLLMVVALGCGIWLSRAAIDRWIFGRFELQLSDRAETVAGNEFRMPGALFVRRRFRLDGASLPQGLAERERAREVLTAMLREGKVRIEFLSVDGREPEPWRVRLRSGGRDLGQELITRGLLLPAETVKLPTATAPKAPAQPLPSGAATSERISREESDVEPTPWWVRDRPRARWIVWSALGLLGAFGLGLMCNGVAIGGGLLLAPAAAALYDLVRAQRASEALAPPLFALALIALFGGYCAVRLRPYVEE